MLKVQKKDGVWRAVIVGRPSSDLRTALVSLQRAASVETKTLVEILRDDPCGDRTCVGCDIAGCDPEKSAEEFAIQAEIECAHDLGLDPDAVKAWDDPVEDGDQKEGS